MISLKKLFQQGGPGSGFQDHKGRPGEQGGSVPRGGSGGVKHDPPMASLRRKQEIRAYKKGLGGKADTPRKTANTISKITGERLGASLGQRGVLAGRFSKGDVGSIGTALIDSGFEKYSDPYKQDWVTSYRKGKIRVHLDTKGNRVTVSETFEPNIPYD